MLILLILLIVLFLGTGPWYPYSTSWGYYPSGFVMVLIIILLFFLFGGRRF